MLLLELTLHKERALLVINFCILLAVSALDNTKCCSFSLLLCLQQLTFLFEFLMLGQNN
jgi:hypothetical protein